MIPKDQTPIIVGAGQCVERRNTNASPMDLAGRAAQSAIGASEGQGVVESIDTIAVIKLFADSTRLWASKLGKSNNPPQSIANRIGATPSSRIYSLAGGNEPLALLMEAFADLQAGRRRCVLLCGGEAIKNQRHAERQGVDLDWAEDHDTPLEDRGFGMWLASQQERHNGLLLPLHYYSLMEDYRRQRLGLDRDTYRRQACDMLLAMNDIAAKNPFSQYPDTLTAQDLLSATPLTHLYTKRMVAQDSVNQGAAVLLSTVGNARKMRIPEHNWIYLHGAAQGVESDMSVRQDPGASPVAGHVVDRCFSTAGVNLGAVSLIDIYSCFPVAVTAIAEHLQKATDGSEQLTLTGGLPFFGGPGNNYSTHALAEVWHRLRESTGEFAYIHANGGMLSKHGGGLFSGTPSAIDWSTADPYVNVSESSGVPWVQHPTGGQIVASSVHYLRGEPVQGVVLAEDSQGRRFVSHTDKDDQHTVLTMLDEEPAGRRVRVRRNQKNDYAISFSFA